MIMFIEQLGDCQHKLLMNDKWIFVIQKRLLKKILKILLKKILEKRLSKNLSNVNPNLEFELRDKSSEIIKENNSIINNQMIHESFIEAQFMNLTNYSLTQKRMNDLANRRGTIRNQMNQISKIVNISPNKTHYGIKRLESLQNIVQILKRRTTRLISKSAYVFYKLSQAQLINLYKLRSVFQYYETSLFLKNEIKDYFGAQEIIHSELRTKKLPNSGMNPWKNWLKSNYQYEQLINSNYQNAKAPLLLLQNEKENLIKNHKYKVLSYKFVFHEDTKDSYSYRIPFQRNKNKEFFYTNNYNIHKGNLIDIKKGRIGAWIHNKYTKIEPKNYQFAYEFDIDDEIIDEKEKEIDEKEKKECFDDKNDIFYHKIYQELNRSRNRSHQEKSIFDWMGMNEEIKSSCIDRILPWTIPINLLFSNFENFSKNEKKNEKGSVNKKKNENPIVNRKKNEKAIVNEKKNENPIDAVTIYKKKHVGHKRTFRSFI
ncbi:hypothetical protein Cgig2_001908 [Carnegiea gigantea]|uniref:Translocon at the inner envelope membrane of chloroplasts 214 n=1 Tax=Carnegiea gigantea TaxID=171969 RepID=A0A9Q1K887_9CARY|nr:hypothetical protein Cgig2_001908 [Carnegiea gigantea]